MISQPDPTTNFPVGMGKVPPRELHAHGITSLTKATKYSEKELLAIHGVGPKAVRILKEALAKQNLKLQDS